MPSTRSDADELFVQLMHEPVALRLAKLQAICDREDVQKQVMLLLDAEEDARRSSWLEQSPLATICEQENDETATQNGSVATKS